MSNGPDPATTTDPAPPAAPDDPMEGFAEALGLMGDPEGAGGPPEPAAAADDDTDPKAPEPTEPEASGEPEPGPEAGGEGADKPESVPQVSFDGFSDAQAATWARLLKAGQVTPEEIETARKESLFQSAWTKKTMALAEERKALQEQMQERQEDLALLDRLRSDDRLHAAWLRLKSSADAPEPDEGEGGDDLVDRKTAEQIADQRLERRLREHQERMKKEQDAYEKKKDELSKTLQEAMRLHGIDREQAAAYLEAEAAMLPPTEDLILRFSADDLAHRMVLRHEAAQARAEAKAAREAAAKRTQAGVRAAKQSLPPARRVALNGDDSPLAKTEADLGLDPDWSNVQGFGFRSS